MSTHQADASRVFVVHGRNEAARKALFEFLRSVGLKPLEWSQAVKLSGEGSPFVGEILDAAFSAVQAVIVLLTGDDLAMLLPDLRKAQEPEFETQPTPQPRPNVLFEAGMAFGRHPRHTVLVQLGESRPFSDIGGRHVIRLDDSVGARQDLATRLQAAGCAVDLTGTDWHSSGHFRAAIPSPAPLVVPAANEWMSDITPGEEATLRLLNDVLLTKTSVYQGYHITADFVARRLSVAYSEAKSYLTSLEERKLVEAIHYLGRATEYTISMEGRHLMVRSGSD